MKKIISIIIAVIGIFSASAQTKIYVAPNGNDNAHGTLKKPLKTIQMAIGKAEKLQDVAIEIILRGGDYPQTQSIEFERNSFVGKSLVIKAFEGEKASITGGQSIAVSEARKVSKHEIYMRLQPQFRDKIKEVDLSKSGIAIEGLRPSGFGRPCLPSWSELFVNDSPLTISRWPNDSMALIGKIEIAGDDNDKKSGRLPVFHYDTSRPKTWKSYDNLWIGGYFGHGYADDLIPASHINTADSTIHMAAFTTYQFMTGAPFRQWYAVNLPEEIDQPGEYVIDTIAKSFYFLPPTTTIKSLKVSTLSQPLIAIENNANITLRNIIFEVSRGMGVYLENTRNVLIDSCTFRNLGNVAVSVGHGTLAEPNSTVKPHAAEAGGPTKQRVIGDVMGRLYQDVIYNRNAGQNNGITNCYIYNVGAGGIHLSGGDRETLTRGNNYVQNCKISNYNRIEKSYRPGIWIDGVGNRVTKCDIFNAPSMAILFHGNDHIIELCKITNVCTEVDDQGAIYYGRDPSERGHVIRYCYFHELSPKHRVTATYHDDGACGTTVHGNIYHRAGSMPVLIGGGHDNNYYGNIFIESPLAIHIDNRMQGWGAFMVKPNAVIDSRLQAVKHTLPPYATAYPELTKYWDEKPEVPKRNTFHANLFYKIDNVLNGSSSWGDWWNNWTTNTNPGFVDPENPLLGLYPDALIHRYITDFPEIPFADIGSSLH